MARVTRRKALQLGTGGLLGAFVGLSGCQAIPSLAGNDQQNVSIGQIEVNNKDRSPHEFHVLILEHEKPVFWRSYSADGGIYEDGQLQQVGGTIWDHPVKEPGRYVIYSRLDGRSNWTRVELTELGRSCFRLIIQLDTQGVLEIFHGGCDE